jgi:hypothetical protein
VTPTTASIVAAARDLLFRTAIVIVLLLRSTAFLDG